MPTREVSEGRDQIYSNFQQPKSPTDHFHHLLIQITINEFDSWTDLKIAHADLKVSTIKLNDRLSWAPRDTHSAPRKDELLKKGERFINLGRILLDQESTNSFWVVCEVDGKVCLGISQRGLWFHGYPRYLRKLEKCWRDSNRGETPDWSTESQIGEISEEILATLDKETFPEEMQSLMSHLRLSSPLTPPQSPMANNQPPSTTTTSIVKDLDPRELQELNPQQREEFRLFLEEEKNKILSDLVDLNEKSYLVGQPKREKSRDLTTMSLADRFLARHVSPNMLSYLNTIPNDTVEHCEIADKALDEQVAKKFRAM